MAEQIIPIITEVGEISGRNAIYLKRVNMIDECTFELTGTLSGSLCSNLPNKEYRSYKIVFEGVHLFKMIELDFDEVEYRSSFDRIENSKQILKMIETDKTDHIGKIDDSYKHFVFRTYDTVFEIVGKSFQLTVA